MAEFPYTPNPANVRRFLEFIQDAGVPSRVTQTYLEASGFTSTNDRYLMPVMKVLGFLDATGQPTETWRAFRDRAQSKAVLASAIRNTYSGLFENYPDAPGRPNDAIRNYFSAHSTAGSAALGRMVGTFRNLCSMADFDAAAKSPGAARVQPAALFAPAPASVQTPSPEQTDPEMPGAQQYQLEGVYIKIIPSRKNIDRARKILEVVELSLPE